MNGDKFEYLMDTSLLFFCCVCVLMVTGFLFFLYSLLVTYGLSLVVPLAIAAYIWKKEPNDDE